MPLRIRAGNHVRCEKRLQIAQATKRSCEHAQYPHEPQPVLIEGADRASNGNEARGDGDHENDAEDAERGPSPRRERAAVVRPNERRRGSS